jgi:hypothetical protein
MTLWGAIMMRVGHPLSLDYALDKFSIPAVAAASSGSIPEDDCP